MSERTFSGTVKAGRFVPENGPAWVVALGKLEGKRVVVTLEPHRERRSLKQNARYFACIVPIVAEVLTQAVEKAMGPGQLPVSSDQAHEKCKEHFLGFVDTPLGRIPKSTRVLDTAEFSAYCERIEGWLATSWGVVVPERGESL